MTSGGKKTFKDGNVDDDDNNNADDEDEDECGDGDADSVDSLKEEEDRRRREGFDPAREQASRWGGRSVSSREGDFGSNI